MVETGARDLRGHGFGFPELVEGTDELLPGFNRLEFKSCGGEDMASFEEAFIGALFELKGDKKLGANDFSLAFLQFTRDFVKEAVIGFFR